jgi:TPR repeat protein
LSVLDRARTGEAVANEVSKDETLPWQCGVMMCCVRALLVLFLVAVIAVPVRASDADSAFRSGLSAFNAGRYALALEEWGPLAAAGDARAQESMGYMYYGGRGVARDSRKAASFFYRAANQGEPTAQLFLAIMHFRGDGVPRSTPLAMMWSELAMSGGLSEAYELNDTIMQSMSEAERAEGRRLTVRWRELFAAAKRKSDSGMRK